MKRMRRGAVPDSVGVSLAGWKTCKEVSVLSLLLRG